MTKQDSDTTQNGETDDQLKEQIKRIQSALGSNALQEALQQFDALPDELTADVDTYHHLGSIAFSLGRFPQAAAFLTQALALKPDTLPMLNLLGAAYLNNGDYQAAYDYLHRSLEIAPESKDALLLMGILLSNVRQYGDALEYLSKARALDPDNALVLLKLASVYNNLDQLPEALECAEKSLQKDDSSAETHQVIGSIYAKLGEREDAIRHFEEGIKRDSTLGLCYFGLSQLKKFTADESDFIESAEQVLTGGLMDGDRSAIHFSLGKIYDDLRVWHKAFQHFQQANSLKAPKQPVLPPYQAFEQIKKAFYRHRDDSLQINTSKAPLFIISMPRSGSTLVEQIISSHPDVAAAGELGTMALDVWNQVFYPQEKGLEEIEQHFVHEQLRGYARHYLDVLRQGREEAKRITDKTPENFMYIGLILLLFPNARIVHVTRHPLDIGLSIYFQMFDRLAWSNDFESIAHTYRFYRECMAFWKKALPRNAIYDVSYEMLVSDPESQSRQLLEYCGLEWHPECLNYFKRKGKVSTASLWQVRQPVYTSSMQRWVNYAEGLAPYAKEIRKYLGKEDIKLLKKHGVKMGFAGFFRS